MTDPIVLNDLNDAELFELVGSEPPTALLGSGISIWDPTNLPSGAAFGTAVFRALFLNDAGVLDDPLGEELEVLFRKIPFENVMEQCPDPEALTGWLKETYNVTRHNAIHNHLAKALGDRTIHSIVTTNYDCCLDQALSEQENGQGASNGKRTIRIVTQTDLATSQNRDRCYFKIHGSADDVSGESLVFRLGHESALPAWKRELLRQLLARRTLLVIGYSGLDFEICPEIPLANPTRVIWNFRSLEDITPTARLVMEQVAGEILIADMRSLLSRVFSPIDASIGSPSVNIELMIKTKFSERTMKLWKARLLNNLSYGKSAQSVAIELLNMSTPDPLEGIWMMEESARALHYQGAYKRAAQTYDSAISLARAEVLPITKICGLMLDASDNWRCYGGFRRSSARLREAKSLATLHALNDPELLANIALKELLLLRRKYQSAALLGIRSVMGRTRVRAESLIKAAAEPLLASGAWFSLQQLRLWTDRFDLPPSITCPPDYYEAPPPRQGYEHLGYPVAQMMVFRDEVDTGRRVLNEESAQEAIEKSALAERLGLNPEVWKLNYLALKRFPSLRKKEIFWKFLKYFWVCEYSLMMRVILLIIRP